MKHVAKIQIDENSGLVKLGRRGHIDFWMYAKFDPLATCDIVAVLD